MRDCMGELCTYLYVCVYCMGELCTYLYVCVYCMGELCTYLCMRVNRFDNGYESLVHKKYSYSQ